MVLCMKRRTLYSSSSENPIKIVSSDMNDKLESEASVVSVRRTDIRTYIYRIIIRVLNDSIIVIRNILCS